MSVYFSGHSFSSVIEEPRRPNPIDIDRSQPGISVRIFALSPEKRVWLPSSRHGQNRTLSFQSIRKFCFSSRNHQRIARIGAQILLCHFQHLGHSVPHLLDTQHWVMCIWHSLWCLPDHWVLGQLPKCFFQCQPRVQLLPIQQYWAPRIESLCHLLERRKQVFLHHCLSTDPFDFLHYWISDSSRWLRTYWTTSKNSGRLHLVCLRFWVSILHFSKKLVKMPLLCLWHICWCAHYYLSFQRIYQEICTGSKGHCYRMLKVIELVLVLLVTMIILALWQPVTAICKFYSDGK